MTTTFDSIVSDQGWNANSILQVLMHVVDKNKKTHALSEYACRRAFEENNWSTPELVFDPEEDGGYSFSDVTFQQGWNDASLVSVVQDFIEEAHLEESLIQEAQYIAEIESNSFP